MIPIPYRYHSFKRKREGQNVGRQAAGLGRIAVNPVLVKEGKLINEELTKGCRSIIECLQPLYEFQQDRNSV